MLYFPVCFLLLTLQSQLCLNQLRILIAYDTLDKIRLPRNNTCYSLYIMQEIQLFIACSNHTLVQNYVLHVFSVHFVLNFTTQFFIIQYIDYSIPSFFHLVRYLHFLTVF